MQRFWIAIPCVITSVILLSFCLVDQSAARERNVAGWCNRQCKAAYGLRAPATRGWGPEVKCGFYGCFVCRWIIPGAWYSCRGPVRPYSR
jgi:hypothetical protein